MLALATATPVLSLGFALRVGAILTAAIFAVRAIVRVVVFV